MCRPRVDAIVLQCEGARAVDQGRSFSYVQVNLSYVTIVPLVLEELDVPIYSLLINLYIFSNENVIFD